MNTANATAKPPEIGAPSLGTGAARPDPAAEKAARLVHLRRRLPMAEAEAVRAQTRLDRALADAAPFAHAVDLADAALTESGAALQRLKAAIAAAEGK